MESKKSAQLKSESHVQSHSQMSEGKDRNPKEYRLRDSYYTHEHSYKDHSDHHHHHHHESEHHHHHHHHPHQNVPAMAGLIESSSVMQMLSHDLRADEADILFLKRRILYPGIFDQESDDDDEEKPPEQRRVIRPPCRVEGVPPIVVKEEERVNKAIEAHRKNKKEDNDDISCGSASLSGLSKDSFNDKVKVRQSVVGFKRQTIQKTMDGRGVEVLEEADYDYSNFFMTKGGSCETDKFVPHRLKRPQDENICEEPHQLKSDKKPLQVKIDLLKQYDEEEFTEKGSMVADSMLSLTEKLCLLEQESKKPLTLKERYVGNRKIAGYPQCIDKTTMNLECLPMGEIVRNAIDTMKLYGIPELVPLARDQFVSLMRNLENHNNNDYICLVYALPFSHQEFNPYFFRIVKYYQVGNRIHYTMSKYGALYFSNGLAEYTSMLQFQSQMRIYDKVRSIPFFQTYRLWKAFYIWRCKIRVVKMKAYKTDLVDHLFITKRPLRLMLLELTKMCDKMNKLSFLKIKHGENYLLVDFTQHQMKHLKDVSDRFRAFESMVIEMTGAACRATLIEEGFSPDNYPEEMEYYMKQLEIPVQNLGKAFNVTLGYPGQWLSFSQQRRKRQVCKRLADFIRLVDYIVQKTYHKLLKNSMFVLMLELHARLKHIPQAYYFGFSSEDKFRKLTEKVKTYYGLPLLSENESPIFDIGCFWNDEELIFSPSIVDYIKGFRGVYGCWRQVVLSYKNMLSLSIFHPYTQPIINGYVDQKVCGNGPSLEMFLDLDKDLEDLTRMTELILRHAFHIADKYIKTFNAIRIFCLENQNLDLDVLKDETDVRTLAKWLDKFRTQMEVLKEVEDSKSMGPFRVNNSILRAHANPTIVRCLDVLRHVIPTLRAEAMEKYNQRQMEMEEEEADDMELVNEDEEYSEYILHLDDLQEEMDGIEKDLVIFRRKSKQVQVLLD